MKSVKDLKVYQLGFDLAITVYKATENFPLNERFVYVAKGSAAELETQVDLAVALGFMKNNVADNLVKDVEEVLRMLSGLIHSLTTNTNH